MGLVGRLKFPDENHKRKNESFGCHAATWCQILGSDHGHYLSDRIVQSRSRDERPKLMVIKSVVLKMLMIVLILF